VPGRPEAAPGVKTGQHRNRRDPVTGNHTIRPFLNRLVVLADVFLGRRQRVDRSTNQQ